MWHPLREEVNNRALHTVMSVTIAHGEGLLRRPERWGLCYFD
jgi:hypothetical protein